MQDSRFNTISVQQAIAGSDATAYTVGLLFQAGDRACRVMVRNISVAVDFQLSFDASTLQALPAAAGIYTLPAGACDVFVLAPRQSLYAIANGTNGRACVAVSEALPAELKS